MIPYKDFIEMMERRGYVLRDHIKINGHDLNIQTFSVKKRSIGKILELSCPSDTIISACGKTHPGEHNGTYSCEIRCFNEDGEEAFQDLHHSVPLTFNQHVIAELIVTKIMQKEPNKDDPNIQELSKYVNPILKIIGSNSPCEYPMWSGVYKLFSKDFLNNSFNLYSNEKIVFYAINPDIDITKVKFNIEVDILKNKLCKELYVLDKNKITNTGCTEYRSKINLGI